jgi:protein TonB
VFEQATIDYGPGKRVWTSFAGFTGQSLLIAAVVMAPMIWPQVLPRSQAMITSIYDPGPPPPAPPDAGPRVTPTKSQVPTRPWKDIPVAPTRIPVTINMDPDPPAVLLSSSSVGVPGGMTDDVPGGLLGSIGESVARLFPQLHPPEPAKAPVAKAAPAPPKLVPVGGRVKMARGLFQPSPEYPMLAKAAHISGAVQLEGIIAIDGRIRALRAVSGHPLLVKAAIDAVNRWMYEPTTLNGEPVEVLAPITVTFRLN